MLAAALFAALAIAAFPDKPYIPVGAVLALGVVAVAIARPVLLVCVAIIAIPLDGFVPTLPLGPSMLLIGAAGFGWVVRWVVRTPRALPNQPALVAFALLVAITTAGLLFAPEPLFVARQIVIWGALLIVAVFIALECDETDVRWMLLAVALCGALAGALAIVRPAPAVAGTDAFGFAVEGTGRATAGLGSPNVLGVLVGMALPIQAAFIIRGTAILRLIGVGTAALSAAGIALAVSRGSIVGLLAAFVLLLFWAPFRRWAIVLAPIVLALALLGVKPLSTAFGSFYERFTETRSNTASKERWNVWEKTPPMIADHPIFGVGAFQYAQHAQEYDLPVGFAAVDWSHAHNLYLQIAAELGLLGLAAFLGMIIFVGGALTRVVRFATGFMEAMGWALIAAFSVQLASGLVDYVLGAAPIAVGTFVLVGCALALTRCVQAEASKARAERPPAPTRAPTRPAPHAA